jgi:hypothetical protein
MIGLPLHIFPETEFFEKTRFLKIIIIPKEQ